MVHSKASLTKNQRYSLAKPTESIEMNALKRCGGMQWSYKRYENGETRLNHRRSLAKARFSRFVLPINARVSLIGRGTTDCLGFMWISRTDQLYPSYTFPFLFFPFIPTFLPFWRTLRRMSSRIESSWNVTKVISWNWQFHVSFSLSGRGFRRPRMERTLQVRLATCIFVRPRGCARVSYAHAFRSVRRVIYSALVRLVTLRERLDSSFRPHHPKFLRVFFSLPLFRGNSSYDAIKPLCSVEIKFFSKYFGNF